MKKFFLFGCCLLLSSWVIANETIISFQSQAEKTQFETLTQQLRCLVCQNQNIAESNSGLAQDLRVEIYNQIKKGKTDQAIAAYLKARYGDYIFYNPPLTLATYILWFGPLASLIVGLVFLFTYLKKK